MNVSNDEIIYCKGFFDGMLTKSCDDYLYGDCHLFAIALQNYFKENSRIVLAWQHEDENCSDFGFLAHAFVVVNEKYWVDCRGIIDEKLIKEEYIEDEDAFYFIEDNTEKILNDYMKNLYLENFLDEEQEQLNAFISENSFCYYFE